MAYQDYGRIVPHYQAPIQQAQNSQSYPIAPQGNVYYSYPSQQSYNNPVLPPANIISKPVPKNTDERLSINGTEKTLSESQISVDPLTKETILTIKTSATNYNLNYSTKDGSYSISDKFSNARYGAPGMETKVTSERNDNRYSMDIAHGADGSVEYKIKLNKNLDGIKFSVGNETYVYKAVSAASTLKAANLPSSSVTNNSLANTNVNNNIAPQEFNPLNNGSVDHLSYGPSPSTYIPKSMNTGPILTLPNTLPKNSAPVDVKPITPSSSAPIDVKPMDTIPNNTAPTDVLPMSKSNTAPNNSAPIDVQPMSQLNSSPNSAPVDVRPMETSHVVQAIPDIQLNKASRYIDNDLKEFKNTLSSFMYSPTYYLNELSKATDGPDRLQALQGAYDQEKGQKGSMKKDVLASRTIYGLSDMALEILGWNIKS